MTVLLMPLAPSPGQAADSATDTSIELDPMAARYQLGHGLPLGDSGFTLGGYGEASYRDPESTDWQLGLDSLSALLWWDSGKRWRFFSEVELTDGLILRPGDSTTDEAHVISERLYLDYARSDRLKLRVGKFLTPVGRWNLYHAAPLTWTTSRPLITEATFPTNATGAMVYGTLPLLPEGLEYSLYVSPGKELFPAPGLDTFTEAFGGRLSTLVLPHLQVGVSALTFEQESSRDQRKNLLGADFAWSWRRFEFSGEFAYRTLRGSEETQDEQGHYLQLVAPLTQHLYAVARYEGFHSANASGDLSLYLGGLTWRPMPALSLKAEYVETTDNAAGVPDGLLASLAVLF